jgi:hypothetical protein
MGQRLGHFLIIDDPKVLNWRHKWLIDLTFELKPAQRKFC